MRLASRTSRALAALLLIVLVAPLGAGTVRAIVHFATSFDLASGAPGGGPPILAEGGSVVLFGQPDVFVPTVDAQGNGILSVVSNPTTQPTHLDAVLTTPFKGSQVDIEFTLSHSGAWTDLVCGAVDDSDGGMIDLESGDDGKGGGVIEVDGVKLPYPTSSTGKFAVRLSLRAPTIGPTTWTLTISTQNGAETKSTSAAGLLGVPAGKLTLGKVIFTRPATTTGGGYLIDDLVVSTPISSLVPTN